MFNKHTVEIAGLDVPQLETGRSPSADGAVLRLGEQAVGSPPAVASKTPPSSIHVCLLNIEVFFHVHKLRPLETQKTMRRWRDG